MQHQRRGEFLPAKDCAAVGSDKGLRLTTVPPRRTSQYEASQGQQEEKLGFHLWAGRYGVQNDE